MEQSTILQSTLFPRAISLRDAATALGTCKRTIERLIQRGELKAFRVGRTWRVVECDLKAYVARQLEETERLYGQSSN